MLTATGCSSIRGYPKSVVDEKSEINALIQYFDAEVMTNYNNLKKDPGEQRKYRDEVITGKIRAIDINFGIFERKLNFEKNAEQIGTDWAVLGLSGGGAVAGGATAKAILAGISAGVTGAKLSWDKNLYYEKTMPALLAQMHANRAKQMLVIRTGLEKSVDNYSLPQALSDVDDYYRGGSIPGAIIAITESAGAKTEAAKAQTAELLEGTFSKDKSTRILRNFWKPKDVVDPTNEAALKGWLKKNGKPDDLYAFLYFKEYAEARAKAVEDLGLGK
jgi:hypothetical protein